MVLAVAVVIAGLYLASAVCIPVVAALLLSMLFKPVVRRLEDAGVAPPVSALIIMSVLFIALAAGVLSGTEAVRTWMDRMPEATSEIKLKFRDLRDRFRQVSEATESITELADNDPADDAGPGDKPDKPAPVPVEIKGSGLPTVVMSRTAATIAGMTVMLVTAFFMLASGDLLLRQLVQAMPSLRHKKGAVEAWRDLESHVSAYLVTVTLINIGLGLAV